MIPRKKLTWPRDICHSDQSRRDISIVTGGHTLFEGFPIKREKLLNDFKITLRWIFLVVQFIRHFLVLDVHRRSS